MTDFSLLEIDADPTPAPEPKTAPEDLMKVAEQIVAEAASMPVVFPALPTTADMKTSQGVAMSPRMARCYTWLRLHVAAGFDPFWTDGMVELHARKIDIAIELAESLPAATENRDDLLADLRSVRSRTPDARVTGTPGAKEQMAEAKRALQDDLLAVEGGNQVTGAVVYWTMSGDVDLAKLGDAWKVAGLPAEWMPAPPSPKAAIGRAAKELQTRQRLVRQDPKGGWSFVYESTVELELSYETGARVYLAGPFSDQLELDPETAFAPGASEDFERVKLEYARVRATVGAVDASAWLIWIANQLKAVSLRDRGGVYFVPRSSTDQFRKVRDCLKAASASRVFMIPAMRSADAVAAILDAVTREANELAEDTRGVLVEDLGSRAAKSRIESIDALLEKIAGYEKLLGVKITTADLRDLRTKVSAYCPNAALLEVD